MLKLWIYFSLIPLTPVDAHRFPCNTLEGSANLPTQDTSINQVLQALATSPAVIWKDKLFHYISFHNKPFPEGAGRESLGLSSPVHSGRILVDVTPIARTVVCPPPIYSLIKASHLEAVTKGKKKQGNTRKAVPQGACTAGCIKEDVKEAPCCTWGEESEPV